MRLTLAVLGIVVIFLASVVTDASAPPEPQGFHIVQKLGEIKTAQTMSHFRQADLVGESGYRGRWSTPAVPGCAPDRLQQTVLFDDDFEDGNVDGWSTLSNWDIEQEGDNQVLSASGDAFGVAGSLAWVDYSLEARVKVKSGEGVLAGFRLSESTGAYILGMTHDGLFLGKERSGGDFTQLATVSTPFDPDTWYIIRIAVVGSGSADIRVYVDRTLKLIYRDEQDPLRFGVVFFAPLEEGSHVQVDDVLVVGEACAEAAWARTNGLPLGGAVSALAVDPSSPGIVYAGVENLGLVRTTDGGASWNHVGYPPEHNIRAVTLDPLNPDVVYFTTLWGLHIIPRNGGHPWDEVVFGQELPVVTALAMAPTGGVGYAATLQGVYKTANGWESWSETALDLPEGSHVSALAVDPANPEIVYAGTRKGESDLPETGAGLFKTSDGGSTWAAINNGLTSLEINALLVDPGNPQVVYAGTVNGLFKTVDGGELWSPADDGLTNRNVKALTIDPTDSQVLYAGTGGAGLFRTADGGARWAATAFQNHARPEGDVRSLAIDPFDSATVYIGTAEGLFKLAGGGASYVSLNTPIDDSPVGSVAFDPRDPEVVYAGQFCWRDIFKSENGGDDWRWIGPAGDWHKDHTYVMEIGIDPSDPQALYTTTVDGIFKSFDGGEGWATFLNPLQHRHLHGFAIAPSSPNILYAGTAEGGVPVAGAHVYRSVNRGASWQQMDNGFPTDRETSIEVIAVDPMDADVVYVGTSSHHFGFAEDVEAVGIFKSVNGGEKWDAINRGLTNLEIHDIAIDPSDPDVLYAATGEGVFRSTDGGGRWQAASQGLLASEVTSLAIHPSSPAVIYAGTSGGGVFKSRDGGDNWYPVDFGLTAFSVGDLALDASGEVIYAAALTGGVFRGRAQPLVHKVYLPLIAKDRP